MEEILAAEGPDPDYEEAIKENLEVIERFNKELTAIEAQIAAARGNSGEESPFTHSTLTHLILALGRVFPLLKAYRVFELVLDSLSSTLVLISTVHAHNGLVQYTCAFF